MARSNTVYGPARRPIFDPTAVSGNRKRNIAAAPIQEVSWSWGGDIRPEDLDSNVSPMWRGIDYGLLGGTPADVQVVQISALLADRFTTATISVHLFCDTFGVLDTIALGNPSVGQTQNLDAIIPDGDRVWVTAESTGTDGVVDIHGLSFLMRYRYVEHVETGGEG